MFFFLLLISAMVNDGKLMTLRSGSVVVIPCYSPDLFGLFDLFSACVNVFLCVCVSHNVVEDSVYFPSPAVSMSMSAVLFEFQVVPPFT